MSNSISLFHSMPLVCDSLSHEALSALNRRIQRLSADHPLHKECIDGNVHVFIQDNVLVFHSASGFFFEYMTCANADLETEIARAIKTPREYHCSAFEVDATNPDVVQMLRDRFVEQHGAKLASQIQDCVISFHGKRLMLVKFPASVLRHMMAPTGGVLKTGFRGLIQSLVKIPTLVRLGAIDPAYVEEDGVINHMVATEYKEGYYPLVQRIHWDIVREVIARPHSGIALFPVACWDA